MHVIDFSLQRVNDVLVEVDLRELLGAAEAAGAEDVDLHQLVADDVQADQEHAVLNQFGPHDFGDSQLQVADLRPAPALPPA